MNRRYLHARSHLEALLRYERTRADRNCGSCSLVVFEPATDRRQWPLITWQITRLLMARARATDELGWFRDDRICALLPDTPPWGACRFARDVCDALARRAVDARCTIYSYPSTSVVGDASAADAAVVRRGASRNGRMAQEYRAGPAAPTRPDADAGRRERAGDATTRRRAPDVRPLEGLLTRPLPWWKRTMDVAGASMGLLLLAPIMLTVAAAVKLSSPGPVLFTQFRSGVGGVAFAMYKFRTMAVDAEARKQELMPYNEQDGPAFKMRDDPRVTPLGRLLRKTSLDELPQLWNVLKGDMTLVGPRPLPCDETLACAPWHRQRLEVTPGLTCIWQIHGRSRVTFDEWVRMDVRYSRGRTLLHDLKLLLQTVPAVLLRRSGL